MNKKYGFLNHVITDDKNWKLEERQAWKEKGDQSLQGIVKNHVQNTEFLAPVSELAQELCNKTYSVPEAPTKPYKAPISAN